MNVLLVYCNTYSYLSCPPVGLSLLTEPLRQAGHTVNLLDLMKEKNPDRVLSRALERYRPDIVGFSLRNLDNQSYRDTVDFVQDYARWIGRVPEAIPTIIGGSAVMTMPREMLKRVGATYALVGQGDRAMVEFLEELESKRGGFRTPGLMWWEDGKIHHNPGLFDGYPDGGRMDWRAIDHKRYRSSYMSCAVITKTGCPHRCLFCDAHVSFGASYVPREPEAILEDLRRDARDYKFNRLDYFFIDALFNEPLSWAKRLLEAIVTSELKLSFSVIIEPTGNIDREFARLLRRAGCNMVTTLLGSVEEGMLERMRRPFTVENVDRAMAIFDEEKIHYMPQFMLGGPGETRETVLANLSHLDRWNPLMVSATYGIRILPKAGIQNVALEEGVITNDTDLLKPTFYMAEALKDDREWLDKQMKRFNRFRMGSLLQWADYLGRSMRVRFQY